MGGQWRALIRLIPAHAGKTEDPLLVPGWSAAHPRSRGENSCRAKSPAQKMGSSPLTRGKLNANFAEVKALGLIPAHAGKTWSLLAAW